MTQSAVAHTWTHARWVLRTTWRNGEQLLLVIGLPLLAYIAITRTDFLPATPQPLVVVVTMVLMATGFVSPAITLAFDRRYGSFAFLGTTPLSRGSIITGTLVAIAISTTIAIALLSIIATVSSGNTPPMPWLALATIAGLISLVPWAFVLGGTIRAETVLVVANGFFVVAALFGGVLIPASSLPYGSLLMWLPPGAIVALADGSSPWGAGVLIAWGIVGVLIARRFFRWR